MLSSAKEQLYPNLRRHGYNVTSEETIHKKVRYNCVAWAALGDTKKWWQAGIGPDFYWPRGVDDDDSFQSYIQLFELLGYKTVSIDDRKMQFLFERIALFAFSDGEFSHVSYQLFRGWTSKLGGWEDIRHNSLEALEGGDYGNVKVIMRKCSNLRGYFARAAFNFTSRIWPVNRPP